MKKCELCKTSDASSGKAKYCFICKSVVMENKARDRSKRNYLKSK